MNLPLPAAGNAPEPSDLPGTARVNHSQILLMYCDMQESSYFALYSKDKDGRAFPLLIYSEQLFYLPIPL